MLLYAVDGWRRPSDEITHSLMGCYKALSRAHVPVDFLDVSELEAGGAGKYKVLYLPYCYALSAQSAAAIRRFAEQGGTVWADGLVAWKDQNGVTKQMPPGPLSDVFGFTLEDIVAEWEPFALTPSQATAGELWRCLIPVGTAGSLLEGTGGRAIAIEHRFGKGRAQYFGTALTLSYLRREDARAGGWIAGPAIEASADAPVRMTQGPGNVVCRGLQSQNRHAAVLNNWGAAAQVAVRFPAAAGSVTNILTGDRLALAGGEARLELKEGASAVLLTI